MQSKCLQYAALLLCCPLHGSGIMAYQVAPVQATARLRSYTAGFTYTCTSLYAKGLIGSNVTVSASQLCQRPQDYNRGSALVAFNSTSFYDDLLWSSAWMYHLTGTHQCQACSLHQHVAFCASYVQPGVIKLENEKTNTPDVAVCCVVNGQTASQGASLLCYSQKQTMCVQTCYSPQ